MKELVVSSLIGYFFGCFQTAILIGRIFKNVDIREHGSSNAGASNTTVVLGLPYGLLTAFFDILKSVIAIGIVRHLYPGETLLPVVAGVLAVFGHIFPIFFGFKGGKGVAPLIGTVLALDPLIGFAVVLVSIGAALITDYVVVGSTTIYVLFVLMMIFNADSVVGIWLALALLLIAIFKHLSNYQRILNKTEMKIRSAFDGQNQYRI